MAAKIEALPPHREGSWFAVPVEPKGYAVGIVARMQVNQWGGIAIGYFFGPRRLTLPTLADLLDYTPNNALMVCRFGDLGLVQGSWPIVANTPASVRSKWPMPPFFREDLLANRSTKVFFSESDILEVVSESPIDAAEAQRLPRDGLYGDRAVELVLTKLIAEQEARK